MPPLAIVPDFDPLEEDRSGLGAGSEPMPINALALERREETLRGRVVITVASAAHATDDPRLFKRGLIIVTGILTAPVTVTEQSGNGMTVRKRHGKRRENQRAFQGR